MVFRELALRMPQCIKRVSPCHTSHRVSRAVQKQQPALNLRESRRTLIVPPDKRSSPLAPSEHRQLFGQNALVLRWVVAKRRRLRQGLLYQSSVNSPCSLPRFALCSSCRLYRRMISRRQRHPIRKPILRSMPELQLSPRCHNSAPNQRHIFNGTACRSKSEGRVVSALFLQ